MDRRLCSLDVTAKLACTLCGLYRRSRTFPQLVIVSIPIVPFGKGKKGGEKIAGLIVWQCCTTIMVIGDQILVAKVQVLVGAAYSPAIIKISGLVICFISKP